MTYDGGLLDWRLADFDPYAIKLVGLGGHADVAHAKNKNSGEHGGIQDNETFEEVGQEWL